MRTQHISIAEVEYITHRLAQVLLKWDESIPDFGSRVPHILESCLLTPFQTFGGRSLYSGTLDKAAILFYLLIKNHPFKNGNKRVAMVTLLYFLDQNKLWLKVDNQEFYNFAKWVAASNPRLKNATVMAIKDFLKQTVLNVVSRAF